MNFLEQSLRLSGRTEPYSFEGNWSSKEKEVIIAVVSQHVPERVDCTFNCWEFIKYGKNDFLMKRLTWDIPVYRNSAEELAQRLLEYYSN